MQRPSVAGDQAGRRRRRRLLWAGVAVVMALVHLWPTSAAAHPFGEPQTVRLSAEGATVTMTWSAAPDDLVSLAGVLGALPNRRTYVIEPNAGTGAEPVGASDAELIQTSDAVASYLADHLRVRQSGVECASEVSIADLVDEGAHVRFECPRTVTDVEVEVTTLTDLHPAYRTVALGDGAEPDRALYTATELVHAWSFGHARAPGQPSRTPAAPPVGLEGIGGTGQALLAAFDDAVAPVAILLAAAIGAAHGLAPGHGKTLAGAYLVGARGQRKHAVVLAVWVAVMHTVSVLGLGLVWWVAVDDGPVPLDNVTQWAQLAVATMVLGVGILLVHRRWRRRTHDHDHSHAHTGSETGRSWPALAGIAASGGLVPSPSAFLVLVSGMLTGKSTLALWMVAAFGVGLAFTVLVAGMMALAGRDWLDRRSHHRRLNLVIRSMPMIGAAGVVVAGGLLWASAFAGLVAAG